MTKSSEGQNIEHVGGGRLRRACRYVGAAAAGRRRKERVEETRFA